MQYSCVIATYHRADRLSKALQSLDHQTLLPESVIIVDGDPQESARPVTDGFQGKFPVTYLQSPIASAAQQRNLGAEQVHTPFIVFLDDDVEMEPRLFEKIASSFERHPEVAGIAPRMNGFSHTKPRGLLWWYYRLQAGYSHPDYGGQIFGAAVNCIPCYDQSSDDLIEGNWLNAGIVIYRTEIFNQYLFPKFEGYSWMEDAYLSAAIARNHPVRWHQHATYDHYPSTSPAKKNRFQIAQMRMRNQYLLAKDLLPPKGLPLCFKFLLLKLFITIHLLRQRPEDWHKEILGTWIPF